MKQLWNWFTNQPKTDAEIITSVNKLARKVRES